MDLGIRERVAIVGGSSKGMGKATALALVREGASVTICARTEAELRKAEIDIARASTQHHVLAVPADLSHVEDIRRVVRSTFNRFGRIDILVNNLGQPPMRRPSELTDSEWDEALELNFFSAVRMSREVIPYMQQQQWGRIVNRLSIPTRQSPRHQGVSISSPMAVVGYAKMLAAEMALFNVTVNNVLTGPVDTHGLASLYEAEAQAHGHTIGETIKGVVRDIPIGRLGKPEEVGDLIVFLASERASYITGASIPLDGGSTHHTL